MTRILNCSDAHADWLTQGVPRYEDVAEAFEQTVRTAIAEKVGLYLFTGDLSNPDDGPRALRAVGLAISVATRLARAGIESWWLSGNHDVIEDGSGRTVLSPLRALGTEKVKVFEAPDACQIPRSAAGAILLPYPPASAPYDPGAVVRAFRRDSGSAISLVAGHLTEASGIEPGEESLEMSRGRGVPFPFAECDPEWVLVNGHWHRGQTFRTGPYALHVPGALARLNHGEEKARPRYLILEV